jgi:hypothetical protein
MTDPELFKYDIRVRERMLKRGELNEPDLERHLSSLEDLETKCSRVDQPQPALGSASDGSGRPSVAPPTPVSDDEMEAS